MAISHLQLSEEEKSQFTIYEKNQIDKQGMDHKCATLSEKLKNDQCS